MKLRTINLQNPSTTKRKPTPSGLAPPIFCLTLFCLALFCFASGSIPVVCAQPEEPTPRKLIRSEKPVHPAVLKMLGIGGVVRLNATVLANGTVTHVAVLGGNPILAESAVKAVMKWKYAPAPVTSNVVITLDFSGH